MKKLGILLMTFALITTPGLLMTSFSQEIPVAFLRCERDWFGRFRVRQFDGGGFGASELPDSCADALAQLLTRNEPEPEVEFLAARLAPTGCIQAQPSGFAGVLYILAPGCGLIEK